MDRIEIEIKLNRDCAWLLERLGSMSAEELEAPRTFSEHDPDSRWSFAEHFVHTALIEQNWNAMFRRHVAGEQGLEAGQDEAGRAHGHQAQAVRHAAAGS